MTLIGAIVVEWSDAESTLAWFYSMFICGPNIPGDPMHPGLWASMETFDMVSNFRQKRAMLLTAAKRRFLSKEVLDKFKVLLQALQDSGDARIAIAHGRWGLDDKQYPDSLVWTRGIGGIEDAKVYDEADFIAELDKITRASGNLSSFFNNEIFPILKASAEIHVKQIRSIVDDSKDGI
ncbi:MAG TPA: hypothetical protein VGZ00_04595 [Candidatus Baltobacteraceae bacterium]|jgi:hypothetical protein|nr:hypothetical protein [Candidatus Baltobacteraceae bacterium]